MSGFTVLKVIIYYTLFINACQVKMIKAIFGKRSRSGDRSYKKRGLVVVGGLSESRIIMDYLGDADFVLHTSKIYFHETASIAKSAIRQQKVHA